MFLFKVGLLIGSQLGTENRKGLERVRSDGSTPQGGNAKRTAAPADNSNKRQESNTKVPESGYQ